MVVHVKWLICRKRKLTFMDPQVKLEITCPASVLFVVSTFTIYEYLGTKSVVILSYIYLFSNLKTHTQLPTVEENTCNIYGQRDSFHSSITKTRLKNPTLNFPTLLNTQSTSHHAAHQLLRLHHLPAHNTCQGPNQRNSCAIGYRKW